MVFIVLVILLMVLVIICLLFILLCLLTCMRKFRTAGVCQHHLLNIVRKGTFLAGLADVYGPMSGWVWWIYTPSHTRDLYTTVFPFPGDSSHFKLEWNPLYSHKSNLKGMSFCLLSRSYTCPRWDDAWCATTMWIRVKATERPGH